MLESGLCWRIGSGANISVLEDAWVPRIENCRINVWVSVWVSVGNFTQVADFINAETNEWRVELVNDTFPSEIASKIV